MKEKDKDMECAVTQWFMRNTLKWSEYVDRMHHDSLVNQIYMSEAECGEDA